MSEITSETSEPISQWLEQVRENGDPNAIERIWATYYQRLVQIARQRFTAKPLGVVDEFDVAQSALASFYFQIQQGRFPLLCDRHGLWKLLLTITLNKVRGECRKEGRREELLHLMLYPYLSSHDRSEEFAASVSELLDHLLVNLGDPLLRSIALAKLQGYTHEEIAEQIGRSVPTVERKLRRIRELWEHRPD